MVVPAFSTSDMGRGNMGPDGKGPVFMAKFMGPEGGDHGCMGMGAFMGCLDNNTSKPKGFTVKHSGEGFATNGSQSHVMNINLRGQVNLEPEAMKEIISDNKTLGQIKSETMAAIDAATTYNGSLMFGEDRYVLRNIKWTSTDGKNATMSADVAGPVTFEKFANKTEMRCGDRDNCTRMNESEMRAKFEEMKAKIDAEINNAPAAGHISMTVAPSDEKFVVGQGKLTMGSTTYNVLVNMGHGMNKMLFSKDGHMGAMGMMGNHDGMMGAMMGNHDGMMGAMGMMGNHDGKMGCQKDMPGQDCSGHQDGMKR